MHATPGSSANGKRARQEVGYNLSGNNKDIMPPPAHHRRSYPAPALKEEPPARFLAVNPAPRKGATPSLPSLSAGVSAPMKGPFAESFAAAAAAAASAHPAASASASFAAKKGGGACASGASAATVGGKADGISASGAERGGAHAVAQPSANFHAYKAEFQGTALRVYVPKDLGGRCIRECLRFQLGGDNGIGKALELGNSRSSFKGSRDKIKEGKNLMSVISLREALGFLDRTTKDRARAQHMKRFIHDVVVPKLERGELPPWGGGTQRAPDHPGLDEFIRKLILATEKLESCLQHKEVAGYLAELKRAVRAKGERDVRVVLVGGAGAGKSHLGNRTGTPNAASSRAAHHLRVYLRECFGCAVVDGKIRLVAPEVVKLPEAVVGGVVGKAEVEGAEGGVFGRMQMLAGSVAARLTEGQRLAVEALLLESPAIGLPAGYTLFDTPGTPSVSTSPALQQLLQRADVIVPCSARQPLSDRLIRALLWPGLFFRPRPPLFLIPLDYCTVGAGGSAGGGAGCGEGWDGGGVAGDACGGCGCGCGCGAGPGESSNGKAWGDMAPWPAGMAGMAGMNGSASSLDLPFSAAAVGAAAGGSAGPHADERRAYLRARFASVARCGALAPCVDVHQRAQLSAHLAHTLQVLPPGVLSFQEHPVLQSHVLQHDNQMLLWAATTLAFTLNGLLTRHGLLPNPHNNIHHSSNSNSGGSGSGKAHWEHVRYKSQQCFLSAFREEIIQQLDALRCEVQDYLETCAWASDGSERWWRRMVSFVVGALRQSFEGLGDVACALMLDEQEAAIAMLASSSSHP
ncbi:unnamed protein product [Closterium sp. Yama58-4]|nr:unnamed protein product [Closterium sp. Yama58-4]